MHPDADGHQQARWQAVVISRLDLDARVTWFSARRMAVGRPRASERAKIAPEQPVVASPRLVSPREGKKRKRGRRCCRTDDVAAASDGLPTSPRARNSVTVRAVDIADAYSMSDGSSPGGRRGR